MNNSAKLILKIFSFLKCTQYIMLSSNALYLISFWQQLRYEASPHWWLQFFFAISLRVYGEGSYNSKLEYSTRVRKVSPTFGRAPQVLVTKWYISSLLNGVSVWNIFITGDVYGECYKFRNILHAPWPIVYIPVNAWFPIRSPNKWQ